ncbi:TetR/AcrR family transcriptional regulator [Nocardia sp. CDC153]|uniref:TetR/AcrR family transcriptional regulator n=1 Tax=Nocardia sp. CDC153 TaxID=3112167 RepID=UPI002DBBDB38|nr:TetR/AcrR family transcriptional regulator [Nocardia sp. CDC153]MEC3958735.1 TetR/AcrR family transcriptional regulator [Nocardia sp. CDC153]
MSPRKAAALRGSDEALRDHLVTTAQRLLAEQGAAGLTVRAIARAAGVADGVLYNHFSDKDELLAAALGAHVAAAHAELGPLPAPGTATVRDNLTAYLRAGLALHRTVLPVFAGLLTAPAVLDRFAESEAREADWRELLATYLRAERDLTRLAPDTDIEATTALLVGICHDAVLTALLPGAPHTPVDPDAVITTLWAGIAPRA